MRFTRTCSSDATTTLFADSSTISANDWSPDGQSLLCVESRQTQVLLLPLFPETPGANRKMQIVRDTPDRKLRGAISVIHREAPGFTGRGHSSGLE